MISYTSCFKTFFLLLFSALTACNPDKQRTDKNMFTEFIASQTLTEYPSGSTISYFDGHLYLMGDDASKLIILDSAFNQKREIQFFVNDEYRIQKAEKADIESSEWILKDNKAKLWLFGSGSLSPQRDSAFCFDPQTQTVDRVDLGKFYQKLHQAGIPELNIEAAATVKDRLVFGSRGNLTNKQNFLIYISANDFPEDTSPSIVPINLPDDAGISGMSYLADLDILLITASKENTATAYDDGEIGESYLGAIYNFSEKIADAAVKPDEWFTLSELHPEFAVQKVESICTLRSDESEVTAVLVSDNDQGATKLFTVRLRFE